MTACEDVTNNRQLAERGKDQGWFTRTGGGYRAPERYESNLTAVDPLTGSDDGLKIFTSMAHAHG